MFHHEILTKSQSILPRLPFATVSVHVIRVLLWSLLFQSILYAFRSWNSPFYSPEYTKRLISKFIQNIEFSQKEMSSHIPLDKQFARLGLTELSTGSSGGSNYDSSPDSLRKFGPSVPPKPKKAQPQVPVIPKSNPVIPSYSSLEPSYSTVLTTSGMLNHLPDPPQEYANLYTNESARGGPIYSNVHHHETRGYFPPPPLEDDLPLPPPPPADLSYYSGLDVSVDSVGVPHHLLHHFPPPPSGDGEELASPPSPVSSSYSELRRAVGPGSTSGSIAGCNYAPLSQASNYESLYEPIHPRPHSTLSHQSTMSSLTHQMYTTPFPSAYSNSVDGYGAGGAGSEGSVGGDAPPPPPPPPGTAAAPAKNPAKEEEVDALTSLLVQSMDNAADPEFFGMCAECGLKVVGEGTGCTAMDRVFHIACFTCRVCGCRLQGKPFYAVDGEPDCQECYLNSLEKCCVCGEAILDRILRATGKPYHPQCFTCIECNLCLDGIPFTVDAANRIHCIDDFHKKFAPRCSVCHDPIMPEPGQEETVRVVALDRSFHVKCYKCEDCDLLLTSEAEGRGCYPLDGRVLCKSCNAIRVNALTSCVSTEL